MHVWFVVVALECGLWGTGVGDGRWFAECVSSFYILAYSWITRGVEPRVHTLARGAYKAKG